MNRLIQQISYISLRLLQQRTSSPFSIKSLAWREIGSSSVHPLSPEAGEIEILLPPFKVGVAPVVSIEWWGEALKKIHTIAYSTIKYGSAEGTILKEENARLRREEDRLRLEKDHLRLENNRLMGEKDILRNERDSLIKDKDNLVTEKDRLTESLEKSQAELLNSKANWDSFIDKAKVGVKMYADGLVCFSNKLSEYKARLTALGEVVTPDNSTPNSPLSDEVPAQDPALDTDQTNIGS